MRAYTLDLHSYHNVYMNMAGLACLVNHGEHDVEDDVDVDDEEGPEVEQRDGAVLDVSRQHHVRVVHLGGSPCFDPR